MATLSWYSNTSPSRLEVAGMLAGRQPRGMFGGDLLTLLITGVPTRDRVFLWDLSHASLCRPAK